MVGHQKLGHNHTNLPTPALWCLTIYFCSPKRYVNVVSVKNMFILCAAEVSHNMLYVRLDKGITLKASFETTTYLDLSVTLVNS